MTFDLDLDPMTLILKLDIDIRKINLPTKNEVCSSRHSKVGIRAGVGAGVGARVRVRVRAWPYTF